MTHRWQVAHVRHAVRYGAVGIAVLASGACGTDPVQSRHVPPVPPAAMLGAGYRVRQLDPLPGHLSSAASSVNRRGQVVGVSVDARGATHAVMWHGSEIRNVGSLGGGSSVANAVSDSAHVVGVSTTSAGEAHAFVWRRGVMMDLGTLPGGTYSEATGVNASGQVVGFGDSQAGVRGFLWQQGTMTELAPLPGGRKSRAYGINAEGVVAGHAEPELLPTHAVTWWAGRARDLGTMQGTRRDFATAYAINARGQVVGTEASGPPRFGIRAFRWERGQFTDLTAIAGIDASAFGINDRGDVVGTTLLGSALLWRDGAVIVLGAPAGFVSSSASAINAAGVVVGSGTDEAGVRRALVWMP